MLRYLFSLLNFEKVSVTVLHGERHLLNTLLLHSALLLYCCYIFQQRTDDGNNSVVLVLVPNRCPSGPPVSIL